MTPKSVRRDIEFAVQEVEPKALFLSADIARRLDDLSDLGTSLPMIAGWGLGHGLATDIDDLVDRGSAVEPDVHFNDDAIRTIKFTSGTTGAPKGCVANHRSMMMSVLTYLVQTPPIAPQDICMVPVSFSSGFGLNSLAAYAYRGAETVIQERFDAGEMLDLIAETSVIRACAVPVMIGALTEEQAARPRKLASLKLLGYSASPASLALIRRAAEVLDCDFYQGYGSTETGGRITYLSPEDHRRILADSEDVLGRAVIPCGREAPGYQIRLVDNELREVGEQQVGELMVRGASSFVAYWNDPEKTRETIHNHWLLTGDLAQKDENGFYYIVDRKRDMIISGGYNVYSVEVESVLMEHSAVREAAVIGVLDPRWGEAVHGCVILNEGHSIPPADLIAHCKRNLSAYKVPKAVHLFDDFPRTTVGKVRKVELRLALAQEDTFESASARAGM